MHKLWCFILAVLMTVIVMCVTGCSGGSSSSSSGGTANYSISGTVTLRGAVFAGANIFAANTSAPTDSNGNYTISGLANGTYTLTPSLPGYSFTPTNLTVTVNGVNLTGKSFEVTANSIQLPATGQTTSYTSSDDGALRKGVAWPNPRFTDNNNGTVTDNLTGLVWLKNASCTDTVAGVTPSSSGLAWRLAVGWSANLAAGNCGLSDNSTVGQWRLPNRKELMSLLDRSQYDPALPAGHPFVLAQPVTIQPLSYWSSSGYVGTGRDAWVVSIIDGGVWNRPFAQSYYLWPVRSGQ